MRVETTKPPQRKPTDDLSTLPLSGDGSVNLLERLSVLPAGAFGDDGETVFADRRWGKGLHGERVAGHAVNQQSGVGGVPGKVRQVLRMKLAGVFAELFGEDFCVVRADLEGDDRTDVAKHGIGGRFVKLLQVLVGDCQAQAILASLAQDRSERAGCKILELVDVVPKNRGAS